MPIMCCRARCRNPMARCTWSWLTPSAPTFPPSAPPPTASASCPRSMSSSDVLRHILGRPTLRWPGQSLAQRLQYGPEFPKKSQPLPWQDYQLLLVSCSHKRPQPRLARACGSCMPGGGNLSNPSAGRLESGRHVARLAAVTCPPSSSVHGDNALVLGRQGLAQAVHLFAGLLARILHEEVRDCE